MDLENQYRTDRAVKAILSHFTIYNILTQPLVNKESCFCC